MTEEEFWQSAEDDVVFAIKETLSTYQECRIGLAGGSTPKTLYERLANADLPWEKIKLVIIDERYVPSDNSNSNLRMIRNSLIKKIPLPPENLIAFDTSLPLESAAKDMSRKLINLSSDRYPVFDLLILGAGEDGHIASLFEGDEALTAKEYATPAHAAGYEIEERLTLTLMALKSSSRAILLLKGEKKLPVMRAINGESTELKLTALHELIEEMPVKLLYL